MANTDTALSIDLYVVLGYICGRPTNQDRRIRPTNFGANRVSLPRELRLLYQALSKCRAELNRLSIFDQIQQNAYRI